MTPPREEALRDLRRLILRLSTLACEVDEAIDALEDRDLNDAELEYAVLPLGHLTLAVSRFGQIVYEARKLDDRPRRQRLGVAA